MNNQQLFFDIISPDQSSIEQAASQSKGITLPKRPSPISSSPLEFLQSRIIDYVTSMEELFDSTPRIPYKIRILEILLGKAIPQLTLMKHQGTITFEEVLRKLKGENGNEDEP